MQRRTVELWDEAPLLTRRPGVVAEIWRGVWFTAGFCSAFVALAVGAWWVLR